MLGAFVNAFRVPDLRKKILFTLLIIAVYRFGAHVPTPGIDVDAAQRFAAGASGGVFQFINLFSGGALTQMAIFALGIMPYITSSIIMQLLTVVIPKLEAWSKEGETGQKKVTQWTRYLTVVLAILQSTGLAFLFHNGSIQDGAGNPVDLIPNFNAWRV
nr:preprotein translocase subunit SecY [Actinomycetota bacterium]